MKKLVSVILSLVLALSMFTVMASAATAPVEPATVYVSISDAKDTLAVAYMPVIVTDIDNDGSLTINDALYCAHENAYPGGAAKGYKSSLSAWGLSLYTLWGITNGGSYGYYVNNASAWSLADTVKEGDHVYAFVYADTKNFSDAYSYFTETTATSNQGDEVTVSLKKLSYNALWMLEESAVEGAVITVDGKSTGVKTDANGNAVIAVTESGSHVISAQSPEGEIITAPVCVLNVKTNIFSLILYYFRTIVNAIRSIFGK